MDKRSLWFLAIVAIIAAIAAYVISINSGIGIAIETGKKLKQERGAHVLLPQTEYDFGDIKQSGPIVQKDFDVLNDGTEEFVVEKVLTSCSCTTAKMDKDRIKPGEKGVLTVYFDPNYHFESYDQIMRTITIFSNAINDPRPEVKIYMKVEYDLGVDKTKYGVDED